MKMEEENRQEKVSVLFDKVWAMLGSEGLTVGEINAVAQGIVQRLNSIKVGSQPIKPEVVEKKEGSTKNA